jgi:thiamine-phosphate pyrophosphorylase
MARVDFSFYLITDRHQVRSGSLLDVCGAALQAGVRAIQLREKDLPTRSLLAIARELSELTRPSGAHLVINDRIDLALVLGTRAVHLPVRSASPSVARQLLGKNALIARSAHSADEAMQAEAAGADFVVLGPIFETSTKRAFGPPIGLEELARARGRCGIPLFGIGGITPARVCEVRRAGAHGVAVVSSVMTATDVERACIDFLKALKS